MDPFLGEIRVFFSNFAPRGWALCHGQVLSIAQNTALFSLLGTMYGGNGQTTFALPDLRGRAPLHPRESAWDHLGEQTRMTSYWSSDSYSPSALPDVEPEAPKKKQKKQSTAKIEESTESVDRGGRALAELQRLADTLKESGEQTQRMIESQPEIVNRMQSAAAHVLEFQKKSMEGEFGDAGSSLKSLFEAIEKLDQDSNALPELQRFVERLSESQEQVSQIINSQRAVVNRVKTAALHISEYKTNLSRGALGAAGASLQELVKAVTQLNESEASPADANRLQQHRELTGQMTGRSSARFLAANFIIATQGVFPARY